MAKPSSEEMSRIGKSNVRRSKAHERWVANALQDWSGIIFRRRKAEGRGAAIIEVEGAADVIAVGADFKFSVEAKCGSGFSFNALLTNPHTALFTTWWHQASYDANIMTDSRSRKIHPLVFFRPFNGANWIAFPVSATFTYKIPTAANSPLPFPHLITQTYGLNCAPITCNVSHSPKNKQMVTMALEDAIMCRWADFANSVDPKSTFESSNGL